MSGKKRALLAIEWREMSSDISEITVHRDHWFRVAEDAEKLHDYETRDLALCAAEEAEHALSMRRMHA